MDQNWIKTKPEITETLQTNGNWTSHYGMKKIGHDRNEKLLELNGHVHAIHPNLWDTMKVILRGMFIA